jgi:hypothetical protein
MTGAASRYGLDVNATEITLHRCERRPAMLSR